MSLEPDLLRLRALAMLGPHADSVTAQALTRADVTIELDAAGWDSSHGPVRAHRVVLRVPAAVADAIDLRPAVRDALVAAIARALSENEGHSLADLLIVRTTDASGSDRGPYR